MFFLKIIGNQINHDLSITEFTAVSKYDMTLVLPVRHHHLPGSQFQTPKHYPKFMISP